MNCQKILNLIIKNKMCIDFETERESFSEKRIKKKINNFPSLKDIPSLKTR